MRTSWPEAIRRMFNAAGTFVKRSRMPGQFVKPPRMTKGVLDMGFVTAALLVGGGVVLARSLAAGNPLGMFLGLLGIGTGWISRLLLRLLGEMLAASRAAHASQRRALQSLSQVRQMLIEHQQLEAVRAASQSAENSDGQAQPTTTLDLTSLGSGEIANITAAQLDKSVFPRLASALEEEDGEHLAAATAKHLAVNSADDVALSAGVRNKNIFRQWQAAIAAGDLDTTRAIHATLAQALEHELLLPMTAQLGELETIVESAFRKKFAGQVQRHEYAEALETGEEICRLFPNRRIAAEFRRLRPVLLRRVS